MSYLTFQDAGPQIGGAAFQNLTSALDPAPTVIPLQHFVEWFSGDALDSIWTTVQVVGSPTFAMSDTVNGGFQITIPASGGTRGTIWFNGIEHYSNTGSVLIVVFQESASSVISSGPILANTDGGTDDDIAGLLTYAGNSNYNLLTANSGSLNIVDAGIARDTNEHKHKTEVRSSSVLMHVDDVLSAISTSDLPSSALEPVLTTRTLSATAVNLKLRYCEVFNT